MEILLHQDIFQRLFDPAISKADRNLLLKILRNEHSKIIYSKKYFEFIQEHIDEEVFLQIRKNIIDDNGKNVISNEHSTNFEEEFNYLYNKSSNIVCSIAYQISIENINIALISTMQKPNKHWLMLQLAAIQPNPISLNHFDFADDAEIQQFFENIFTIPKKINYISIFDRETTEIRHTRFDVFRNRIKVHYYTFRQRDYWGIKNYFTQKLLLFATREKRITHGRRIVFENFVLISDNAFNNLNIGEDWNLQFEYNPTNATKQLSQTILYQRVN